MKNLKIYLCKRLDEDNSFFVDVFEDFDLFNNKYDLSSELGFIYLDVGLIRPDNRFLKNLFEEFLDKTIISASAKFSLEKLIPESTSLFEFESEHEADPFLIAFLDLNNRIEGKSLNEIKQSVEFPIESLGSRFIMPINKLELSVVVLDLDIRSTNCLRSRGIHKIEDLLKLSDTELLRIDNLGRGSLNLIIDSISKLADEPVFKKKNFLNPTLNSNANIFDFIESLSQHQHIKDKDLSVFFHRIGLRDKPKTLEEIGEKLGVTRERIRQMEAKVIRLNQLTDISAFIDQKITQIRKNKVIPVGIKDLSTYDSWFKGIETKPWIIKKMLQFNKNNKNKCFQIQQNEVISDLNDEFDSIIFEIASYISSVKKYDIELLLNTKLPNAPELFDTARNAIEGFSFKGRKGTAKAVLDIIFSNSKKPMSREKIYEQAISPMIGFTGTQRALDNLLIKKNKKEASEFYLFSEGEFGLFEHFIFIDSDIKIIEDFIQKETDQDGSKQFVCSEILKQLKNSSEFDRLQCKDRIDQYGIKAIVQKANQYNLNRFMFSVKGNLSGTVVQSDLVIEALENSEAPLSLDEIKKYMSIRTNISKNFQMHSRGRIFPLREDIGPENSKKLEIDRVDKGGWTRKVLFRKNKLPKVKWMLIDKHANLNVEKLMIIINKVKTLLLKPEVRNSEEYKKGLDSEEITMLIRNDSDLNQFIGNINLLFSILDRSAYFIIRLKVGERDLKDGLFLTQDFVPSKNISSLNAIKKVMIGINKHGISRKNIELEVERLIERKPQMGQLMSQLSDMEFKYDEYDKLWFKRDRIEI